MAIARSQLARADYLQEYTRRTVQFSSVSRQNRLLKPFMSIKLSFSKQRSHVMRRVTGVINSTLLSESPLRIMPD